MLNITRHRFIQLALLVIFNLGIAHAEETFEDNGTITNVNKAAKSILIGKSRMMIDDKVIVTYKNKQGHFLNIIEEGMQVNISGVIGSNGVYTITSAYIYPKPQ